MPKRKPTGKKRDVITYKVKLIEGDGYCCVSMVDINHQLKKHKIVESHYHIDNGYYDEPEGIKSNEYKYKYPERGKIIKKLGLWNTQITNGILFQCMREQNT